jgi:hypothetical protein
VIGTTWNTADIWLRREVDLGTLSSTEIDNLVFSVYHDENYEIYINGVEAAADTGYASGYLIRPFSQAAKDVVASGPNLLAVHCHQTAGGQGIDVGIATLTSPEIPVSAHLGGRDRQQPDAGRSTRGGTATFAGGASLLRLKTGTDCRDVKAVTVTSLNGCTRQLRARGNDASVDVDAAGLGSGVYLLTVTSLNGETKTFRLLKN